MYVTPRTLLAIIRLAQANAKLNFRDEVKQYDVDEALKLMDFSIRSLRNMKTDKDNKKKCKILMAYFYRKRIQE
jgi:DNA replication licensing factor MCM7